MKIESVNHTNKLRKRGQNFMQKSIENIAKENLTVVIKMEQQTTENVYNGESSIGFFYFLENEVQQFQQPEQRLFNDSKQKIINKFRR